MHTVSSADPLDDLPASAGEVLRCELLVPVQGDLGGALERCEAMALLLDRWQDAFFAALPVEVDRGEESRWAAEAGLSLDDLEAEWEDEQDLWDEPAVILPLEEISEDELEPLELDGDDPLVPVAVEPPLRDDLVSELERALLLLPLRVRLEALVAASALVESWAELLADHEKLLGHLVLAHDDPPVARGHEDLADRHADLHAGGPGHRPHARMQP